MRRKGQSRRLTGAQASLESLPRKAVGRNGCASGTVECECSVRVGDLVTLRVRDHLGSSKSE